MTEKSNTKSSVPFSRDRGRLDVQALGGMLGPVEVILDDRRAIRPFAVAPWADHPAEDWERRRRHCSSACAATGSVFRSAFRARPAPISTPTGSTGSMSILNYPIRRSTGPAPTRTGAWRSRAARPVHEFFARRRTSRSPGSSVAFRRPTAIRPSLSRPASPRARRANCNGAAIRRSGCPRGPARSRYWIGRYVTAFTYPDFFEAGVSRVAHGRTCAGIDAIPMLDGSVQSFAALPLPFDTRPEILLVAGHNGVARLTNRAEGYRVVMEWDPGVFPGVLLWVFEPRPPLRAVERSQPLSRGRAGLRALRSRLRARDQSEVASARQGCCDRDPLFAGARSRDQLPVPVRAGLNQGRAGSLVADSFGLIRCLRLFRRALGAVRLTTRTQRQLRLVARVNLSQSECPAAAFRGCPGSAADNPQPLAGRQREQRTGNLIEKTWIKRALWSACR